MERVWIIIGWSLVFGLGVWMRFDDLGSRPFHADEATGAKITAARMSGEGGSFDPKHYHGPLLGDAAAWMCRLHGEDGWKEMRKRTLRLVPAIAGLLVVLMPVFWRRVLGDRGALLAGGLLMASPLLVYYSRMFIHEMLLVLAGGAVLACFAGDRRRPVLAGVCLGLMFGVKETFAISVLSWGGALVATLCCGGILKNRDALMRWLRVNAREFVSMVGVAVLVSMMIYSRMLTYPAGAWDALRTFFVYETVEGHDKPWWWYLKTFGWPLHAVGRWWWECVLLWLALVVFLTALWPKNQVGAVVHWQRFLGFSIIGHLVLYSVFGYKTPWLMCLPWMQVCLLVGMGAVAWARKPWQSWVVVACGVGFLYPLVMLSRFASGRLSSDARNPYAYVPTRKDVEELEVFLDRLRPLSDRDEVVVVGTDYWPLPWYLRSFAHAGYWSEAPDGLASVPFVLSMPEASSDVIMKLENTHSVLPRGLRSEVPVVLLVRKDLWERWMEEGE